MISRILITVFVVVIMAGLLGVRAETVRKKMVFLCVSSVGITALSFVEVNSYGLIGGCFQLFFRFISLICLLALLCNICKKNKIDRIKDFGGAGRNMPYIFAAATILGMIGIGIPATGTFTGILYSEIGLLAGGYGVFTYIGLVGNAAGIIIPAMILLPLLKQAYFPGLENEPEPVQPEITEENSDLTIVMQRDWIKPGKGLTVLCIIVSVLLTVLCIYQKPVMIIAANLMETIFG